MITGFFLVLIFLPLALLIRIYHTEEVFGKKIEGRMVYGDSIY